MLPIQETHESYETRKINKERLQAILNFAGESILDVGCGNGAYVLELANRYQISGVDYQSFSTWEHNSELFNLSDAAELDTENDSIDTILSFETLEHLPDPQKALREFHRVCRKNIIVTVPNCELTMGMQQSKLIYHHWIDKTHVNFFTMNSIKQLIKDAGFEIHTSYYINQINLLRLITEAFNLSGPQGKITLKMLSRLPSRDYYLTSLIVAQKKQS